jgi:putative transposase
MTLCVNQVIEWLDPAGAVVKVERLLWLNAEATQAVTIELTERRVLPLRRPAQELVQALASGAARLAAPDPAAELWRTEAEISEPQRRRRAAAWEWIEPLLAEGGEEILWARERRGKLVADYAARSGHSKVALYRWLQRYWQGGGNQNALLPHFARCGGPGQPRLAAVPDQGPKRGRPKTYAAAAGAGINLTAEMERRFAQGIQRFYETSARRSLTQAYQRTLETFFHRGFTLVNGVPTPVLPPAAELPTERQFRYWYEQRARDTQREITTRYGERAYQLRHREVLGDATQMAFGPGSLYQIDATPADIYLVSALDRTRIIGRPIIYVCMDVFSRMIAGLCVTLEGPSWMGAMLALENVMSDKVAFCAEYGITIRAEDWPCQHLPESLLADRGELEGARADQLVNALGIRVANTAPYRADWKSIIERHFRSANERIIHGTPGALPQPRERGGADVRLAAALTLDELRRLLIVYALDHNQNHYLAWYRKDEWLIADGVECYPLTLWNWGIRNRAGHLRTLPRDLVRLHLLPGQRAMVTYRGIHFGQGLYYTCARAQQEGWFARARARGAWPVEVCYDPRAIETVYLRGAGTTMLEPCWLLETSRAFRGRDWHEVLDQWASEKEAAASAHDRRLQTQAALQAQQAQIIATAQAQTAAAHAATGTQSKRARTMGILLHRQAEQQQERAQQAWRLDQSSMKTFGMETFGMETSGEKPAPEPVPPSATAYVPPASHVEALRALREEEWKKIPT